MEADALIKSIPKPASNPNSNIIDQNSGVEGQNCFGAVKSRLIDQSAVRFFALLSSSDYPYPSADFAVASLNSIRFYTAFEQPNDSNVQLVLKDSKDVYGDIIGLETISFQKRTCLSILCKKSKFSISQFDPEIAMFNSLFLLNVEEIMGNDLSIGHMNTEYNSSLCSDPNQVCNAFNYCDKYLVCVFNQALGGQNSRSSNQNNFLHITKPWSFFSDEIVSIIDMKFLNGYTDPTLVVLYSKSMIWDGSTTANSETNGFIAISLNFSNDKYPIIWKVDRLPYDSLYILPLIKPLSGCSIVCKNSFHFISQSSAYIHVSLNSSDQSQLSRKLPNMKFSLEKSSSFMNGPNELIVLAKNGQVYKLTFVSDNNNYVSEINVEEIDKIFPASKIFRWSNNNFFVGSSCYHALYSLDKKHLKLNNQIDFLNQSSVATSTTIQDNLSNELPNFSSIMLSASPIGKESSEIFEINQSIIAKGISSIKVDGCTKFWMLQGYQYKPDKKLPKKHSFIILTGNGKSKIVKIKSQFALLSQPQIQTDRETLLAGNVCERNYIFQVTNSQISIFKDLKIVCKLEFEKPALRCVSCSNYFAVGFDSNDFEIHEFKQSNESLKKVYAFKFEGGEIDDFDFTTKFSQSLMSLSQSSANEKNVSNSKLLMQSIDDMLYSDSKSPQKQNPNQMKRPKYDLDKPTQLSLHLFYISNGKTLSIFDIRQNKTIFASLYLDYKINLLKDKFIIKNTDFLSESGSLVKSISTVFYGQNDFKLDLIFTNEHETFSYTMVNGLINHRDQSSLIFKRNKISQYLKSDAKTLMPKPIKLSRSLDESILYFPGPVHEILHYSKNGMQNGPIKLFLKDQSTYASFFSSTINDGNFAFINKDGQLSMVYSDMLSINSWFSGNFVYRKSIFNKRIESLVYSTSKDSIFIVYSEPSPSNMLVRVMQESKDMEKHVVDENFILPDRRLVKCCLIDAKTHEQIQDTEFEFDTNDKFLDAKEMHLVTQGKTTETVEPYIVVGVNSFFGEELPTRGHIEVFQIKENEIDVKQAPNGPRLKLEKLLREEQKGPLTSFCEIKSSICVGLANRIFIFLLQSKKNLLTVSFIDTHFYLNQMHSIRNFVVCGDLQSSCYLLQVDPVSRVISYLAKDVSQNTCLGLGFALSANPSQYHYTNFWVMMSDFNGNLILMSYLPSNWLSNGGKRLIVTGKIHSGSKITRIDNIVASTLLKSDSMQIQNILYDSDGGGSMLKMIDESLYRRLLMLQISLNTYLPSFGGFNRKSFGAEFVKSNINSPVNTVVGPDKMILDGDLLKDFVTLNLYEQDLISKKIGSSVDSIKKDLKLVFD